MKIICGVYIIISPNGRVYIGESRDIIKRWFEDYFKLKNCKGQIRLYNSLKFYGPENHIYQLLEECTFEELKKRERYWQDYFDVLSPIGLNCKLTGTDEKKLVHSEKTKEKIGKIHKGNKYNLGKKHTDETKLKIGEAQKGNKHTLGKKLSEETKKKISKVLKGRETWNKGKKSSVETKEKISKSLKGLNTWTKGRKLTDEHKMKLSLSGKGKNLGKKRTEEQIKKMSEVAIGHKWNLGIKHAEEHTRKIAIAHQKLILQFDLDGNFIREWKGIKEASKILKIHKNQIGGCCRKIKSYNTAGGFVWKFKENND
jgi:group I intron endonuclease